MSYAGIDSSILRKMVILLAAPALASLTLSCATEAPDSSAPDGERDRSRAEADEGDDEDETGDEAAPAGEAADESGTSGQPRARADGGTSAESDVGATPEEKTPAAGTSLWCKALPVIQETCQSCHNPELDFGAPMALKTHADFLADAPDTAGKQVYEVVSARIHDTRNPMPPQRTLTDEQLGALDAWIADGAKPGDDPTCGGAVESGGPKEPEFVWPPPGCETTYKVTAGENGQKATVAPGSEPHPQFIVDAPWGDDEVQAVGFKPITDNKKVLHHWIMYAAQTGAYINGWAPGKDASKLKPYPDDVGVYLPNGARALRLDMHYYNVNGTSEEEVASGVEVCTTTKFRKYSATTFSGFSAFPRIPPGEHDIVGSCTVQVDEPTFIISENPHAHELATYMKLDVQRGSELITLHDAPFNFEEQQVTMLDQPFELKNGDVVTTTCRYNNDTSRMVTFGENTGDEMCFNFVVYYPMGALSCGGRRRSGF